MEVHKHLQNNKIPQEEWIHKTNLYKIINFKEIKEKDSSDLCATKLDY
jgi:hypothetical protein